MAETRPEAALTGTPRLWPDPVGRAFLAALREAVAVHVAPDAERVDVYPVAAIKALARDGYIR